MSTRSPVAFRLYEDGLRTLYQFRRGAQLFHASFREDSVFAMAAYYAWRSAQWADKPAARALGEHALRLASHASERDPLLIRPEVGGEISGDPSALAAAESLAVRYPSDPEGLTLAARVIWEFPRARSLIERAVAMDSAAGVKPGAICRLCDELFLLEFRYAWVEDEPAARELKASLFSPTNGYKRANYELRRAPRRLGRPAEGIPIIRAALHGGIEGSALYVTHTELHELLRSSSTRAICATAWRCTTRRSSGRGGPPIRSSNRDTTPLARGSRPATRLLGYSATRLLGYSATRLLGREAEPPSIIPMSDTDSEAEGTPPWEDAERGLTERLAISH